MKVNKTILIIVLALIIACYVTCVYATEVQLSIGGDSSAKPNDKKTLSVKISSEKEVGVVSGKIETNENISNIQVLGINNWNLTYNKATGAFNIYKAEGSKAEEIIKIEYTVQNKEGTAQVKISNIKMTTIEYETISVKDVVKNIEIKSTTTPDNTTPDNTTPDNTTPDNTTPDNTTPDNTTPDNTKPDNTTPDNTTPDNTTPDNTTPDNTTPDNTKPDNTTPDNTTPGNTIQGNTTTNNTKLDNTQSKNNLPKTGVLVNSFFAIIIVSIIISLSYVFYRRYKNIK